MTEAIAIALPLHAKPGKHNMASAAFEALRAARAEGRTPDEGKLTFGDLVDTLNPLQHIPVISEIYRGVTGDSITPQARVAGATLYGGPIGLVASVVSLAIAGNGEDGIGDSLYASLMQPAEEGSTSALAANEPDGNHAKSEPVETTRQASLAGAAQPQRLAATAQQSTQPMPRLSPEAFEALLGSFSNPETMQTTNATLAAALDPADESGETQMDGPPDDLTDVMRQALDKYEAMKSANTVAAR